MIKKYRVCKSDYYSEESRTLFSSYLFEYFSHRINKWCCLKNVDMKTHLKVLINTYKLFIDDEILLDFDLILKGRIHGE